MLQVLAPVAGRRLAVSDVPDPVFAKGLVGPGLAIEPRTGAQCAIAPVSGRLVKLHPHAYLILSDQGYGVLVHLGIDTVHMDGEGFEVHVSENDTVEAGDAMVTWNPDRVTAAGHSATCAVVVLDCDAAIIQHRVADGEVEARQLLFEIDC